MFCTCSLINNDDWEYSEIILYTDCVYIYIHVCIVYIYYIIHVYNYICSYAI